MKSRDISIYAINLWLDGEIFSLSRPLGEGFYLFDSDRDRPSLDTLSCCAEMDQVVERS